MINVWNESQPNGLGVEVGSRTRMSSTRQEMMGITLTLLVLPASLAPPSDLAHAFRWRSSGLAMPSDLVAADPALEPARVPSDAR